MPDMRMTSEERKDFSTPQDPKAPNYPMGLKLRLGPDELEKIGMQDAPELDKELVFKIKTKVVEVEKEDIEGDERKFNVCLQVIEMDQEGKDKSAPEAFYGG